MSSVRTRFLLLSDFHGQIGQADDLAERTKATAVLHVDFPGILAD